MWQAVSVVQAQQERRLLQDRWGGGSEKAVPPAAGGAQGLGRPGWLRCGCSMGAPGLHKQCGLGAEGTAGRVGRSEEAEAGGGMLMVAAAGVNVRGRRGGLSGLHDKLAVGTRGVCGL